MNLLRDYALSFVGVRYKWGGDNPISGYDCSGLVQELLKSCGMDPPGDQTAQGLYNHFDSIATPGVYGIGALAFYGENLLKITHVAMMLDMYRVIEAGGGSSKTLTISDAEAQGAFVRVRLVKARKDFLTTLKPHYAPIGMVR